MQIVSVPNRCSAEYVTKIVQ